MKTSATRLMRRFASIAHVPETYRELCQIYLPRPIHDDSEDRTASAMMNALAVFPKLNAEQQDYFDVLTEFVDSYDQARPRNAPWPKATGLDVLKHLLAEHSLSAADLSRILGASRNLGSMILRGDRKLTISHVRKLAAHFKVNPQLLV